MNRKETKQWMKEIKIKGRIYEVDKQYEQRKKKRKKETVCKKLWIKDKKKTNEGKHKQTKTKKKLTKRKRI